MEGQMTFDENREPRKALDAPRVWHRSWTAVCGPNPRTVLHVYDVRQLWVPWWRREGDPLPVMFCGEWFIEELVEAGWGLATTEDTGRRWCRSCLAQIENMFAGERARPRRKIDRSG